MCSLTRNINELTRHQIRQQQIYNTTRYPCILLIFINQRFNWIQSVIKAHHLTWNCKEFAVKSKLKSLSTLP